ncbi:MAG: HTTM domain-containing protein [Bacteroidia bacterium]|nr:HTTM domain-containing protein [Bacteroidia bacterium]MCZ2248823.1 HTTM domain-containing protein [Bacteroidia bacterium]
MIKAKINHIFNRLVDHSTLEFKAVNTITLFKNSLLIFLFLYFIQFLPIAKYFLGPDNYMVPYYKSSNIFLKPLNLLEGNAFSQYYLFFNIGILFFIAAYFFLPLKRISLVVIYILLMNIYHKTAPLQNGGFSLLTMVFFMLLFIDEHAANTKNFYWRTIKLAICNFGFLLIRLQIVTLYLVASWYKLQGQTWIDGTAFYYVLYNEMYTQPLFTNAFIDNTFIIKSVSWFTLLFQMLFPFFVWIKKTKKIMIAAGVFFHVMIAWMMGIVDFGIIMILMYTMFNTEEFNTKVLNIFRWKSKANIQEQST